MRLGTNYNNIKTLSLLQVFLIHLMLIWIWTFIKVPWNLNNCTKNVYNTNKTRNSIFYFLDKWKQIPAVILFLLVAKISLTLWPPWYIYNIVESGAKHPLCWLTTNKIPLLLLFFLTVTCLILQKELQH